MAQPGEACGGTGNSSLGKVGEGAPRGSREDLGGHLESKAWAGESGRWVSRPRATVSLRVNVYMKGVKNLGPCL